MKKIAFVTLFPDWIWSTLNHSILARAESSGAVAFEVVNPRNFCYDQHRKVDDVPYGGHPGMLIKAEPVALAIESLLGKPEERSNLPVRSSPTSLSREVPRFVEDVEPLNEPQCDEPTRQEVSNSTITDPPRAERATSSDGEVGEPNPQNQQNTLGEPGEAIERSEYERTSVAIVITEPSGQKFEQPQAEELSTYDQIIFVCGHYEGIDHRIEETYATHVFSIGDYVLTNGELPALVMADAVVRLMPGVLGNENSLEEESFQNDLLGAPNYTRPEVWRGKPIPDVLKSGNHGLIEKWRLEQARQRTQQRRPDLLDKKKESE